MTGWLPKEILDHLAHAGYVAVPKERVVELHAEYVANTPLLMMTYNFVERDEIIKAVKHHLMRVMATEAIRAGCISLERDVLDRDDKLRYRASITVLKPRTIT